MLTFDAVAGSGARLSGSQAARRALELFGKAQRRGELRRLIAGLLGKPTGLARPADPTPSLDSRPPSADYSRAGRVGPVAISDIAGTEDRADGSFDRWFAPAKETTRPRWLGVARAVLEGKDLPAVVLVRSKGRLYVRDGHHRISVFRALGQEVVDARITES